MHGPLQARSACARLLGLMVAASPVLPLGLLHMRPFLWWMKPLGIRPSWPSLRLLKVSGACFRDLLVWRDPSFLLSGVRMGVICHRKTLCVAGVDPMPPLVLSLSPCLSGGRCVSAPLAGHEAVCFPSGQAHPSGAAQGEDMWTPPSPSSPVLAFPDMVLRVNLPPGG